MSKVQKCIKNKYIIYYSTAVICDISSCFLRLLSPFTLSSCTFSANKHFKVGINNGRIDNSFLDT